MLEGLGTAALIVLWLAVMAFLYFTVAGQLIALIGGLIALVAIPIWAFFAD